MFSISEKTVPLECTLDTTPINLQTVKCHHTTPRTETRSVVKFFTAVSNSRLVSIKSRVAVYLFVDYFCCSIKYAKCSVLY